MTTYPLAPDTISPALPALPGYTFRPARLEDMPALHQLLLITAAADGRDRVDSAADLQTQFDDPWSDPQTDSLLGFTADGQLAAFARCFVNPEPEAETFAHLWLEVHPDHREALDDAVFDWLEARAGERLQAAPASLPRSLRVGLPDTLTRYLTALERRGYAPLRYFYRMRRDLHQPIPARPLPHGFALARYSPERDQALLDAFNESFRDHWSFVHVTREEWEMFFTGRTSFRGDLTVLALDGGQVAGFSVNMVDEEENARLGIRQGWVAELGVRRPWRRRGVASALLCESMRLFRADGLDYAGLGVDTENPSGALGLYEGLGFAPVKRLIVYAKPYTASG